jgi:hypothetical protein
MNERLEIMGDWYEAMNLEQERNEALAAAPQSVMTDEDHEDWHDDLAGSDAFEDWRDDA